MLPLVVMQLALVVGEQSPASPAKHEPCIIGAAKMLADRTLVLQLRAQDSSGALGDAVVAYKLGDAKYREVLEHIGGLEPGISKLVPCWSETKPPDT